MRFLIDADLPRKTADVLVAAGHPATHVDDVGLGPADDSVIAAYAQTNGLCLITGDFGFADVRNYPPEDYHGIVVLELPRHATADTILDMVRRLTTQSTVLANLPRRLAIVDPARIRLRPAP